MRSAYEDVLEEKWVSVIPEQGWLLTYSVLNMREFGKN